MIQLPILVARECHCTEYYYIRNLPSCVFTLGDVGTSHTELVNAVMPFSVALYSQPLGTSMESVRYNIFTEKKRNPKVIASHAVLTNYLGPWRQST